MSLLAFGFLAISVVCAYILKSITGFGTSLILVPALTLVFDIKEAIAIAAMGDVVSSALLSYRDKPHLSLGKLKEVGFGLFLGTAIGVLILNLVNATKLKAWLAVFILVYLIVQQINPKIEIRTEWFRKLLAYVLGFIGGICGGIFNTNGPAIFIYIRSAFPSKETIRANLFFLFLLDSVWRVSLYAFNGMITFPAVTTFLLIVFPALLLGLYLGDKLDKKLKTQHYVVISKMVLVISGAKLLIH